MKKITLLCLLLASYGAVFLQLSQSGKDYVLKGF